MTVFVALLRAVNVGGTGKLPVQELVALCTSLGLDRVRTYIQSGNVVFESRRSEKAPRGALVQALTEMLGKPVDVAVRTAVEMRSIHDANPFPAAEPAKTAVVFLAGGVPKGALAGIVAPGGEDLRPGQRAIYIHYPHGMGRSKLKLPASLGVITARNINTIAKLVAMMEG